MPSLLLALATQAHAGCAADLEVAIGRVEAAFAEIDRVEAVEAAGAMDAAFACVTDPIAPRTAARIHRAHALVAHLSGAESGAHLGAMRSADPWLPWDVAAPDHPLTLALHAAEEAGAPSVRNLPSTTDWRVDGLAVPIVPRRTPTLVQVVEAGRVVDRWNGPGNKVPARGGRGGNGAPWTLAGTALAGVAAGLYGGAWAANSSYHRAIEVGDDSRVERMHTVTNSLSVGSLGAAGVAATLLSIGFTR